MVVECKFCFFFYNFFSRLNFCFFFFRLMSNLVYRVYPLPETMKEYIWNFGALDNLDESQYIGEMLKLSFKGTTLFFLNGRKYATCQNKKTKMSIFFLLALLFPEGGVSPQAPQIFHKFSKENLAKFLHTKS